MPPIDAVTDSPGVRLAYRLPIDAASGWVSFTMAAVCLVWNTLVAMFVVQVIQQHRAGQPNWLLTWLMVPFVLAGVWTLLALARQVLLNIAIGTTRVEVSHHPFYPGGTFHGFVSQTGRLHVRWFQVQLVCEEQAIYQQGTDTRRATSRVYRATLFSQRKFDIHAAAGVRSDVRLHSSRLGDALVRLAAQRGDLDARRARPHGPLGRFRTPLSQSMFIPLRVIATAPTEPLAAAARSLSRHDAAADSHHARLADRPLPAGRSAHRPIHGRGHAACGRSRAAELSVLWYTAGKGEEDMAVHHFERLVDEPAKPLDLRVPHRFATVLPPARSATTARS